VVEIYPLEMSEFHTDTKRQFSIQSGFPPLPNRVINKSTEDARNVDLNELSVDISSDAPPPTTTSRSREEGFAGIIDVVRGFAFLSPWWSDYIS
jgi:hypothetical protein